MAYSTLQKKRALNPMEQRRAATSAMDLAAQPSNYFARSPRPAANALYAGSENWDTQPGWMGRAGGTYSYGAGYPTIPASALQSRPDSPTIQRPGAWAQGTRNMMRARPELIASQGQLNEIGSDFSQRAGAISAQSMAMGGVNAYGRYQGTGADARYRGMGAVPAVGGTPIDPLAAAMGGLSGNLSDSQMAAMYPQGRISNPQVHPLYASKPSTTLLELPSGYGDNMPEGFTASPGSAAGRAMRSRFVRNSPGFQTAVDQNANALRQIGEPTVAIMGEPASEYRGKSTDELWGGDKRRAFRQQQQEQLGLTPMADRRAMITARAQGRRLSPEMAAMQRTDPIMAAIVGRDPAAAATFETNRRQMDPEFMERQARGQAMVGLMSGAGASADPAAFAGALPGMMESLMPGGGQPMDGSNPSVPPDLIRTLTGTTDAATAGRLVRMAVQSGRITPEQGESLIQAWSGQEAATMSRPSGPGLFGWSGGGSGRRMPAVTADMFSGAF